MDENSFDPRNWRKNSQEPAKKAEEQSSAEPESTLPEAWRGIGTVLAPAEELDRARAQPALAGGKKAWLIGGAVATVLGGGIAYGWMTREPVAATSPAASPAKKAATAPAGQTERALRLSGPGEIASALVTLGVPQAEADGAAKAAAGILNQPGELRLQAILAPPGAAHRLDRLQVSYQDGSGAVVSRDATGALVATPVAADLTSTISFVPGEIDTESFYSSAVAAGVPDTLVPEFINAFGYDFNLASEVHPGDTFEVAYRQSVNASGEGVGAPELVYAKLTTAEKSLALYRFKQADGTVGWFDGNGAITKRGFMRTPVDGARITSKFGMRFHPTLHYTRLHAGADFGVPVGTPVYAAAEGTVTGATPTGCGGNMVVIQHDNGWVTRYFHLSRYADGLHEGQRVVQGYTVGLSGSTGSCTTGPHLHYELRINGEPVDPLGVPMDDSKRERLKGLDLAKFVEQRNRVDVSRAQQGI